MIIRYSWFSAEGVLRVSELKYTFEKHEEDVIQCVTGRENRVWWNRLPRTLVSRQGGAALLLALQNVAPC
jgi:hypothetical protein